MAFRLSRSAFARIAAPTARVSGRTVSRRMMSSGSHGSEGSDRAWAIGSALVFGPVALYLLSPSAQKKAHHAEQASLPKETAPEPEAAPVPVTPAPQEQTPVEPAPEAAAITDDEGTPASNEEVAESINKAVDEDSPKEAHAAEAAAAAEGDKVISEKAEAPESSTAHEQDAAKSDAPAEDAPSDVGDARQEAKSGNAPAEAKSE